MPDYIREMSKLFIFLEDRIKMINILLHVIRKHLKTRKSFHTDFEARDPEEIKSFTSKHKYLIFKPLDESVLFATFTAFFRRLMKKWSYSEVPEPLKTLRPVSQMKIWHLPFFTLIHKHFLQRRTTGLSNVI